MSSATGCPVSTRKLNNSFEMRITIQFARLDVFSHSTPFWQMFSEPEPLVAHVLPELRIRTEIHDNEINPYVATNRFVRLDKLSPITVTLHLVINTDIQIITDLRILFECKII